ncbi:aldehyde dehydrogenase family protein [Burkholderia sp. JP2-270]|uniref:aldehyde dehydrogenase family protein n=1 Tax=Burkholderia sp. JP2-270 TaxID=2217913 RepID=UPI0019550CC5|nr:aldehyde dehydrogenase family protein [Burkholderia sp. JP2-270]
MGFGHHRVPFRRIARRRRATRDHPLTSPGRARRRRGARDAFAGWRDTPPAERGRILATIAERVEAERDRLTRASAQDSRRVSTTRPARMRRRHCRWAAASASVS